MTTSLPDPSSLSLHIAAHRTDLTVRVSPSPVEASTAHVVFTTRLHNVALSLSHAQASELETALAAYRESRVEVPA